MKLVIKIVAGIVLVTLAGTLTTGCNTVRGAGKDIQKGGQVVVKAADKTQQGTRRAVRGR